MLTTGLLLCFSRAGAQCPAVDFNLQSNACAQEDIFLNNLSAPASSYLWDFCSGDLNGAPQAQTFFSLPGVNGRPGIEFAKDGNKWFGFVTGTYSSTLYRIEFANGTNAPPTFIENLGNLSGKLNNPGQIRIING